MENSSFDYSYDDSEPDDKGRRSSEPNVSIPTSEEIQPGTITKSYLSYTFNEPNDVQDKRRNEEWFPKPKAFIPTQEKIQPHTITESY